MNETGEKRPLGPSEESSGGESFNPYQSPQIASAGTGAANRRKLTLLTAALLALPFLLPIASYYTYQPINEAWTVRQFGCGCPPLDGSWRFNANHFNAILFAIVGGLSIWCWTFATGRAFSRQVRANLYFIGVVVVVLVTLKMLAQATWL